MKELSIEEKAKRYDEAIERANELCCVNDKDSLQRKTVEHIFPQFKESEDENADEKVRKALINLVTNHASMDLFIEYDIHLDEALAWLEKQGEQKPVVDTKVIIPKFRVGDIVKSKSQPMLSPRKIISIGKDCYWCEDRGCIGFAWEDDCEIVEQKSADKVEPKEWSNEEQQIIKDAASFILSCVNTAETKEEEERLEGLADKLQDIRPQSQWKSNDISEKDVDLEEEIKKVQRNYKTIEEYKGYPCTMYANSIEWIARHFFEIGFKTLKRE